MAVREQIQLAPPYHRRNGDRWLRRMAPMCLKENIEPFYLGQPKLNGERMRTESGILYSSSAGIITSVPHISDEINLLIPHNIQLDGELYVHGMPLNQIQSIVSRKVDLHPDFEQMEYHIFDIKSQEPQLTRLKRLQELGERIERSHSLKLVRTVSVTSHESAINLVYDAIDQGFEGAIFRNPLMPYLDGRSVKYMLKCKPRERDEYRIINAFEGKGKYAGTLGALEVVGTEKNALPFHVGSFRAKDGARAELWELHQRGGLIGRTAVILYIEKAASGKLPSSVYKCLLEDEEDYDARHRPVFHR